MLGKFRTKTEGWCLECAGSPCVCLLTYLKLRIKILKGREEEEKQKPANNWRKKRRSINHGEDDEDKMGAGHQHQAIEADAQHGSLGQLQHQHHQGVGVASRLGE